MGEPRAALGDSHAVAVYSSGATDALLILNAILVIFHMIISRYKPGADKNQ